MGNLEPALPSEDVLNVDDDVAAMLRLQAGEDLALNELMARWEKPILAFVFRYLGNQEDAADVAQETFVRVYEHRSSFKGNGKFSSWLFCIAANLCRNQLRWRSRHPTSSLDANHKGENNDEGHQREGQDPGALPWENAQSNDLAAVVRQQVQLLPHDLRVVVLLSVYEERSHSEIAEVLKCTAKAVESRLYRAKQILRNGLAGWLAQ